MAGRRDPRQDQWDAGQREYDATIAEQAAMYPGQQWVPLPGQVKGWTRVSDEVLEENDII